MGVEIYKEYLLKIDKFIEGQFFLQMLDLGIFNYLDKWTSIEEVSKYFNCSNSKLEHLLNVIKSQGYILKKDGLYMNTENTKAYLSTKSNTYIGELLKSRMEMLDIGEINSIIKGEPVIEDTYNFEKYAKISKIEMENFRVKDFSEKIKCEFTDKELKKVLDLGGGSGILAKIVAEEFKSARVFVYDRDSVISKTKENFNLSNYENMSFIQGDFLKDSIGEDYDLIIASGIIDFAADCLEEFVKKLEKALAVKGKLFIYSLTFEESEKRKIKWLKGALKYNHKVVELDEFNKALKDTSLIFVEEDDRGVYPMRIYRKG